MSFYSYPASLVNQLEYLSSDHVNELIWYQLCPKWASRFGPYPIKCLLTVFMQVWQITIQYHLLMSLTVTSSVLNEKEDWSRYGPCAMPSDIMQCCRYPVSLINQPKNPYWVMKLTSLSGTNHVLNEFEALDEYSLYIIPCHRLKQCHVEAFLQVCLICLVISNWASTPHLAIIMYLPCTKVSISMAHMQYHPR